MPASANPLREMPHSLGHLATSDQLRPEPSFVQTSLPGFKQALNARRSMRQFDGTSVPETVMKDCLHDATLAPSASNLQTYELYWVREPANKNAVAAACLSQPPATSAGELVVVVARRDLWRSNLDKMVNIMTRDGTQPLAEPVSDYYTNIVPMLMKNDPLGFSNLSRRAMYWYKGRNEPFMRTPVNQGDHRIHAHIQASLAAQTLMLSIAAHGFESCALGGFDKVRLGRVLKLPAQAEPTVVIAIGRGKAEGLYGPRVRLPDADLIKEV